MSVQLQPLLSAPAPDFLFPLIWENGDWLRVSRDFSGYLKNASHYFPQIVKFFNCQVEWFKKKKKKPRDNMESHGLLLLCLCPVRPSPLNCLGRLAREPRDSASGEWIFFISQMFLAPKGVGGMELRGGDKLRIRSNFVSFAMRRQVG